MIEVRSESQLLEQLCCSGSDTMIAIDGWHGVGKTTLANRVSSILGIRCVHLDDFLLSHRGGFLEFLDYDRLAYALQQRPVLVEGVCMLAVLRRLGQAPGVLVYVKGGEESPLVAARGGAEESPAHVGNETHTSSEVFREVLTYHHHYLPLDHAAILYLGQRRGGDLPMGTRASGPDLDIAFIQARTRFALSLAVGGMISLLVGLVVLLFGIRGDDQTLMTVAGMEVSSRGLGAVIMSTSVLWAFLAYRARPTYARVHESIAKRDPHTGNIEHRELRSSTECLVARRSPKGKEEEW